MKQNERITGGWNSEAGCIGFLIGIRYRGYSDPFNGSPLIGCYERKIFRTEYIESKKNIFSTTMYEYNKILGCIFYKNHAFVMIHECGSYQNLILVPGRCT